MTHRTTPRAWLPALLLALLPGLGSQPAHAQPPAVFSAVEAASDFAESLTAAQPDAVGPPPLRQRLVEIDLALLDTIHEAVDTASATSGTSALTLNLFPDATFPAVVTTVEPTYSGGTALSGHLAGEPLSAFTLVVNDDEVAGSVLTPLDHYELDSTPDWPGGVVIRQMDATSPPGGCEASEPPPLPASELAHPPPDPVVSSGEIVPPSNSSPTIIDIAVFYTPLAKSGRANIESHIDSAVAATNQAFAGSNVNQRLRLVHRGQIAYTESGSLETDIKRLRVGNDGHMDEAHTIRNQVGADLVHLLVAKSSGLCGGAYIMTQINSSWAKNAFGVHHYYCSADGFAHEVGHNLGLRHDRYLDKSNNPQPCAHGYVNRAGLKADAPSSARWYTLMAYSDHCSAANVSCSRIRRFSNANQTWHEDPLGIAGCQSSNGVDGPAHAVETLGNSAGTVAAFRNSTPTFGDETVADYSYIQNHAITALTLPAAKRGDGSLSYTLTEQNQTATLPAGLSFDSSSRTLSGTPTALQTATTYTYTVTDTDDDATSLTFTITISQDLTPSFTSQTIDNQTYHQHDALPALTLPTASGGNGTLSYSLTEQGQTATLPAGLNFAADSRQLSGTPTAFQSAKTYVYTATDTDKDSVSLPFTITITEDTAPSFGTATIPNQTYIHNVSISAQTLPAASGGEGSLTYTLAPRPAGLTLSGRALAGTPTQVQAATAQTYTATDTDGDTATLGFTLTVEADTQPSFGNQTIPTQTYTLNVPIPALTLPAAGGGNRPLSYRLGPDLPTGLSFDASTRTLSGTPTVEVPLTPYPYTVTDADGDTATLPCYLAVVDPVRTEPVDPGPGNTGNTGGSGSGGGGGVPDPAVLHGFFESPADGATVAGIDLIRGWTFAEAPRVTIERVDLYLDGRRHAVIPCCSTREDVTERYPRFPRATTSQSGWGIIQNWGNLTAGEHTVQVVVRSSDGGRWASERHTLTVLKPGDIAYATRFSLAEAEAHIDGRQVVLDGVVIRDQATQAEQELEARYEWRTGAQGLRLVASRPIQTARPRPVGLARLLAGLWSWLSPHSVTANPGLARFYEAPADHARVAGIGLMRGWAFPVAETDAVAAVTVEIDGGTGRESAPCCSARPDIAAAYPDQSNALRSGWGAVTNYGNLSEGAHKLAVRITTEAGLEAVEEHTVTVARLGGYAFVDRFELSGATVELVGEEIILSGVEVRDSATQETQTIEVRLRWSRATQGLVIVDSAILP